MPRARAPSFSPPLANRRSPGCHNKYFHSCPMKQIPELYLCLLLTRAAFADQITLKNGDRLSGAIVKNDGENLTMKSELAGEVTVVAWAAITSVSATGPLYVGLKDGKTVVGAISTQA